MLSNVPFSPQRTAWVWSDECSAGELGADGMERWGFISLLRSPKQKAIASLWTSGPWRGRGREMGKGRNENVLKVEKSASDAKYRGLWLKAPGLGMPMVVSKRYKHRLLAYNWTPQPPSYSFLCFHQSNF